MLRWPLIRLADVPIDPVRLVLAWATVATQVPRDAWAMELAEDVTTALGFCVERIGRRSGTDLELILPELIKMIGPDTELTIVRGWEGLVCISAAITRQLLLANSGASINVMATANVFLTSLRRAFEQGTPSFRHSEVVRGAASSIMAAVDEVIAPLALQRWSNELITEMSRWLDMSASSYQEIALLFDSFARRPLVGRETFEELRAKALVNLCSAQSDVAACEQTLARLDGIIDPAFTGREAFELQRVGALVNLCHLQSDTAACEQALARLEEVIDPTFTGRKAFEEFRAKGLVNLRASQRSGN